MFFPRTILVKKLKRCFFWREKKEFDYEKYALKSKQIAEQELKELDAHLVDDSDSDSFYRLIQPDGACHGPQCGFPYGNRNF